MKLSMVCCALLFACKKAEAPHEQKDPWATGTPEPTAAPSGGEKKWYQTDENPVGVWMGIDERMDAVGLMTGDTLSTHLRLTTMIVWPDGHCSEDAPWTGLADFDYATWARDVQKDASLGGSPATYTRDGDGWKIKFDSGYEQSMKMDGDVLRYRKAKLKRAEDVTGATLDGVYTWWSHPEDPSLGGPGCQQLVRFGSDGTFENRGGFARTCPAADSDPGKPGSGKYEIRDFSLILHYDDGRTDKRLITSRQNADLHADTSAAIIMGQVWSRRSGAVSSDPIAAAPTTTPPPPIVSSEPVTNGDVTTFDVISFKTPPGDLEKNKGLLRYTAKDGDAFCITFVYASVPSTGSLDSDFAADWKDIMLNGRTADETATQRGQTPSGLAFSVGGSMTTENSDKTRVYRALFVFQVGGKRVTVMLVAPTEAQLAGCKIDGLLSSIRGA